MSSTHYECDTKEYAYRRPGAAIESSTSVTAKARIVKKAVDLLLQEPDGLRHSALIQRLSTELPDIPVNTIRGTVVILSEYKTADVYKPAKGLFQHVSYRAESNTSVAVSSVPAPRVREEDYYCSFAHYLTEDLEECTKCIPLGGCTFQDRWGTPDVIGIRKARESDIVKFPTEIVAAEIKLDTRNLIIAFGQACSYRLFAHRSYIVVPRTSPAEDLARLEPLCISVGLGFVLFDADRPVNPNFTIRVRAARHQPDPFYVNRNLRLIEDRLFGG
jgi:hypothetical protein